MAGVTSIETVLIENDPLEHGEVVFREPYSSLPEVFLDALGGLVTSAIDDMLCWRCGGRTAYVLIDGDTGDLVRWRTTCLARVGAGPVAVLCSQCSPDVPTEPLRSP